MLNINKYIDHTILKPNATIEDIKKVCDECKKYDFMMIAINPAQVKLCKQYLKDTNVHLGAAIGFPLGQNTIEVKVYESIDAIKNGANEIDYVINITELKAKNYEYIKNEMQQIVDVCKNNQVISKVIFENCYLEKVEIVKLCEIAMEVKPDYIKTSTGFGISGASVEDVKLMKSIVKDTVKIKAAGGIKNYETFKKMVEAGAERIGTSNSIQIIIESSDDNSCNCQ